MRSLPADDVVVSVDSGSATTLSLESPTDELPTLHLHPTDRLLTLWGRRPAGIEQISLPAGADPRLLAGC
jgi:hypothetical protein